MSSSFDLSGRWMGYYRQYGQEHPITADFQHTDGRLAGVMCDGHPDNELSLFEVAQEAGLQPGADEQIEVSVRQALPDAPRGPIRYVTRLPSGSVLEGRCKGPSVYFLKTYQGSTFSGYRAGDQLLVTERPGHGVHYEGRLSADGTEIDGRWWIDSEQGQRRTEGSFVLRRQLAGERDNS